MAEQIEEKEKVQQVAEVKRYKRLPLSNNNELLDLGKIKIIDPKNLIIIKYPKSGSTLSLCNVPKILIADSEHGTDDFSPNNKVDLLDSSVEGQFELTKKYSYIPKTIYDLVTELYDANGMKEYWEMYNRFQMERDLKVKEVLHTELVDKLNSMPFPILAIDTITSIIGLSNATAIFEYNLSVKPESRKADIKRVDEYGGTQYIRRKFSDIKKFIEQNAAPFIQYHGHIGMRKKQLNKNDKDIDALDIALEGVLSTIFTAQADSVSTFYRNNKGCFLDFLKKDETDLGSRPRHLSNKLIKIADILKGDEEFPKTYWQEVYPSIIFNK